MTNNGSIQVAEIATKFSWISKWRVLAAPNSHDEKKNSILAGRHPQRHMVSRNPPIGVGGGRAPAGRGGCRPAAPATAGGWPPAGGTSAPGPCPTAPGSAATSGSAGPRRTASLRSPAGGGSHLTGKLSLLGKLFLHMNFGKQTRLPKAALGLEPTGEAKCEEQPPGRDKGAKWSGTKRDGYPATWPTICWGCPRVPIGNSL